MPDAPAPISDAGLARLREAYSRDTLAGEVFTYPAGESFYGEVHVVVKYGDLAHWSMRSLLARLDRAEAALAAREKT